MGVGNIFRREMLVRSSPSVLIVIYVRQVRFILCSAMTGHALYTVRLRRHLIF